MRLERTGTSALRQVSRKHYDLPRWLKSQYEAGRLERFRRAGAKRRYGQCPRPLGTGSFVFAEDLLHAAYGPSSARLVGRREGKARPAKVLAGYA